MKKLAEEAGTTVAEMEGVILMASINNRTTNAMNITQMVEDLHYLIQSDMDDRAFQIQRRLADELNRYKGKGNSYVEANIQEIQELYMDEETKREEGRVEDEEVILIKPYKVSSSMSISTHSTSFIEEEIENLIKYMKFEVYEVRQSANTNQTILSTSSLPISQIKRRTRSQVLERSRNGISR